MLPTTYKVIELENGTLSVMAKPVPGEYIDEEFTGFARLGINKIVCLLEDWEQKELGLASEEKLCHKNGIEYLSFPIQDRGLPSTELAIDLAETLYKEICEGNHISIHCRAGIGRTGIIAGAILLQSGISSTEAFDLVSKARGVRVPDTEEQVNWLASIWAKYQTRN
ncbi:protein-tyrosine phosphatase family protein [Aliikangiella coralliicola]|uniref:Protein tyrosine phosphatase n=1 Tax=Aliikangiella coralliicola TaxID=2592383 RepID=A0A545UC68_9GAMM|nr:protein-tyrosine phosphatase family protein [Aliikangiella coralliicola]TQV87071.1 protein tyrosine phosphatase [Aliikangiella coralliicola]